MGLSGLLSAATIGSAFADTVSDKRAQAQSLATQIDALGNKEAALSEQYDKAVLGTQTTGDQVKQAEAGFQTAQANASRVRSALQSEALDSYMHGGNFAVIASRNSPSSLTNSVLRGAYVKTLAGTQADALDAYRFAAAQENEAKNALMEAQLAQNQSLAQVDAARKATPSWRPQRPLARRRPGRQAWARSRRRSPSAGGRARRSRRRGAGSAIPMCGGRLVRTRSTAPG